MKQVKRWGWFSSKLANWSGREKSLIGGWAIFIWGGENVGGRESGWSESEAGGILIDFESIVITFF